LHGNAGGFAEAGQILADVARRDAGEFKAPRFGPRLMGILVDY
jgi:hypothetical protein